MMQVPLPPDVDVSKVSEMWPILKDVLTLIIIPYLGWNFKQNKEILKEIESIKIDVKAVNITLIGQDGRNGIRSRFVDVEHRLQELALNFARAGIRTRSTDHLKQED